MLFVRVSGKKLSGSEIERLRAVGSPLTMLGICFFFFLCARAMDSGRGACREIFPSCSQAVAITAHEQAFSNTQRPKLLRAR